MSVRRSMGTIGAFLVAATAALTFPQGAGAAETGFLWLDSAYAIPAGLVSHSPQWRRVHRVRPTAVNYVVPPSRPRVIEVASATPVRGDCFWCNRPVYISGLSF